MLYHWLASQEGFGMKWRQVFRAYLNRFLKTSFRNATKLKSKFKCDETLSKLFFKYLWIFLEKTEILQQDIPFLFSFKEFLAKFRTKENPHSDCWICAKMHYLILFHTNWFEIFLKLVTPVARIERLSAFWLWHSHWLLT
jgi:hypothetical protein